MCAILDANAASEAFGKHAPEAATKFIERINKGKLQLVVGGKLLDELEITSAREWLKEGITSGAILTENEDVVDEKTRTVRNEGVLKSNDPHVIALAQVSRSRLLYSNDGDLRDDFRNKNLIDQPRGRIYSTKEQKNFVRSHKALLARKDLCQR